jgi:hypothetical protein
MPRYNSLHKQFHKSQLTGKPHHLVRQINELQGSKKRHENAQERLDRGKERVRELRAQAIAHPTTVNRRELIHEIERTSSKAVARNEAKREHERDKETVSEQTATDYYRITDEPLPTVPGVNRPKFLWDDQLYPALYGNIPEGQMNQADLL